MVKLVRPTVLFLAAVIAMVDSAFAEWTLAPAKEFTIGPTGELRLKQWEASGGEREVRRLKVTWATASFSKVEINVATVDRTGPITEIFEGVNCRGDLVMSGGFYKPNGKGGFTQEGLVVSDGKLLSPVANWDSGGAFVVAERRGQIVPRDMLPKLGSVEQALQAKPIVIRGAQNDMRRDDEDRRWSRALVGVTEQDQIFLTVIEGVGAKGLSLFEAAEILLQLNRKAALGLKDVLALDGGPSAHVFVPSRRVHFGSLAKVYVPNVICLRLRQ